MNVPQSENKITNLMETALQEAESGNFALAEELLVRSAGTLESEKQHAGELKARVLHLLANNYRNSGKLTTAHDYYEKARQIFAGEALSEPPFAFYQDMYSQALRENDLDLALNLQQDLWNLLQKSICPPPATRLNNLLRLAALYWTEADYQNADRYLKEYLQLSVVVSARATHEQISVLSYLGLLAFRMNKLEEAESLYKQSLAFSETCPDISNTEQSELLSQLGLVLCSQDRNMEAQTGCLKAEELRGQPGNDPDDQFRSIASVYCARHCFSEAAKYCRSALDIIEMGCAAGKSETLAVILRRLGLADDAGAVATSETPRQTDSSTGA